MPAKQQRARAWYARAGKVHRSKKVMSRVAKLFAAKRKRDAAANTPQARAAASRARKKRAKKQQQLAHERAVLIDQALDSVTSEVG